MKFHPLQRQFYRGSGIPARTMSIRIMGQPGSVLSPGPAARVPRYQAGSLRAEQSVSGFRSAPSGPDSARGDRLPADGDQRQGADGADDHGDGLDDPVAGVPERQAFAVLLEDRKQQGPDHHERDIVQQQLQEHPDDHLDPVGINNPQVIGSVEKGP